METTTRELGSARPLAVPSLTLAVVDGPDAGLHHAVNGVTRIGKGAGAELALKDPTVSRLHCEIRLNAQGARVVDLGSTNGTVVDGVRVFDAELASGSMIRLGATTLKAQYGGEPVLLPLSAREELCGLVGGSVEMRAVYAVIERVAATAATVLLLGETGTGKELAARAIHESSPRKSGPFVAVDCGAIAESLMEAELFGHTRGAFTGASGERRGLVLEAHGGTLFLDEIGELPLRLQPKLLRVLEQREVRALGSDSARKVDMRVVAATHRPLAEQVNAGTFREDLYFRLAVVELELPPLRARKADIAVLARHFWQRFAAQSTPFPEEIAAELLARSWPGNVRELRNFVERAIALGWTRTTAAAAPRAVPAGLEALVPTDLPLAEAKKEFLDRFESVYVAAVLKQTGGNVTRAAEVAGVDRRSLQRIMARLGLRQS